MRRAVIRKRQPRRRGYVLVLFAMLFWVILAMAALVIDLGLARVKYRQMQSATDTAALAGLQSELSGTSDRTEARRLAAQTFYQSIDQDFETYATQQAELSIVDDSPPSGGVLEDPRGRRWVPNLAANTDNVAKGDLQYSPGTSTFYARLRHSTIAPVAGVRNDSPPLPYLFGRATVRTTDRSSEAIYRGVSLKSVSAASTTQALSMGPTVSTPGGETIDGVQYVASVNDWANSTVYDIVIAPEEEPTWYSVGNLAPTSSPDAATMPTGYVAIFDSTITPNRIVGFGYIVNGNPVLDHVAERNATSRLLPMLPSPADPPTPQEYQQLLSTSAEGLVQTFCLLPTPSDEFQED